LLHRLEGGKEERILEKEKKRIEVPPSVFRVGRGDRGALEEFTYKG